MIKSPNEIYNEFDKLNDFREDKDDFGAKADMLYDEEKDRQAVEECSMSPECPCDDCQSWNVKMD